MPDGVKYWLAELRIKLLRLASEICTAEGQEVLDQLMKTDLFELQKAAEEQKKAVILHLKNKIEKVFSEETGNLLTGKVPGDILTTKP